MTVIAVDANGADLGPAEVAAGARIAAQQGVEIVLFGPAVELGEPVPGIEVVDAPVSIAKDPDPVRAVRGTPEASIVAAARAAAGRRRWCATGRRAPRWWPGSCTSDARPACTDRPSR